jgi:hypothetical protein
LQINAAAFAQTFDYVLAISRFRRFARERHP